MQRINLLTFETHIFLNKFYRPIRPIMEIFADFIKILLPAAIVLYAMFLTVRAFLNKELEKKLVEVKLRSTEVVLPVRLQAYERMCLFLERISPNNLILRLNNDVFSATELHHVLLSEIREEYNHNVSQQVYMSDEAWNQVRSAMEEIISIINNAAGQVHAEGRSMDLAKAIFEIIIQQELNPTSKALRFVKDEIRQSF